MGKFIAPTGEAEDGESEMKRTLEHMKFIAPTGEAEDGESEVKRTLEHMKL